MEQCGKGVICWRDLRLGEAAYRKEETRKWVISTGSRDSQTRASKGDSRNGPGEEKLACAKVPQWPGSLLGQLGGFG